MNGLGFARKTVKLRHGIVKLIAPRLWADTLTVDNTIQAIPRPMTLFLKEYMNGKDLVGVEIGVAAGGNAVNMLQLLPIKKLILVDPYIAYVENNAPVSFAKERETAFRETSSYAQVSWILKTSEDARKEIDEPLDFVYIDGNHSYSYVMADILNYYQLLRQGGVIGGHDYTPFHDAGVVKAVNEFVQQTGRLSFHAVFPDWWIIK